MTIVEVCKSIHDLQFQLTVEEELDFARDYPTEWKLVHLWFMGWATPKSAEMKKRLLGMRLKMYHLILQKKDHRVAENNPTVQEPEPKSPEKESEIGS